MFCPESGVENRPGFTHCTDCDVDMVLRLFLLKQRLLLENYRNPIFSCASALRIDFGMVDRQFLRTQIDALGPGAVLKMK